jgi:hypothetical protein
MIISISYAAALFDYLISIFYDVVSVQFRLNGDGVSASNPWLGIPRKLVTFFGIFWFYKKIKNNNINRREQKIYEFYFKMLFFSIFFYIIGSFYIEHVSSRLDVFTGFICTPILIGLIDNKLINKKDRCCFFFLVLFFNLIFYSRLEFFDLYHPYTSIFYNTDYIRNLY